MLSFKYCITFLLFAKHPWRLCTVTTNGLFSHLKVQQSSTVAIIFSHIFHIVKFTTSKITLCKITWQKSEYNFIREKGIACFCKELQRGFWGGSLRALQWEGARDVKIAANHWHSAPQCTQHPPTCENIETFWHQTRSHSPPISTFAANTSLSMLPACCYPLLFWTFQRRFDFWEVAAPFLGQLAHFYESQHPLQAPAPSLLSAHLRLCYCWWWWTWWWCWWWWW